MRDFETRFKTFKPSLTTYEYFTDFKKVFSSVEKHSKEIEVLNELVGAEDIEKRFIKICETKPFALRILPLLIGCRDEKIQINDFKGARSYDFDIINLSPKDYLTFAKRTGILDLLQNKIKGNLKDYLIGVEVGMDTNARKNRTGKIMESLVEQYLIKAGLIRDLDYFCQLNKSKVESMFSLDLSQISNNDKTEKRFDFVVKKNNEIYAIEVNFYNSNGSKINETARSYKNLTIESKNIPHFHFIWVTDGKGWNAAKNNLIETFDVLDDVYNINDLDNNVFGHLFGK